MRIRTSSSWQQAEIEAFLRDTIIPVRLAFLASDGEPLIISLWFEYRDGCVYCASQQDARVIAHLQSSAAVAFEVAGDQPPYRGVRGQGHAELDPAKGGDVLRNLIDRYLGDRNTKFARWLLSRAEDEVAIVIRPDWVTSWDFSQRMPTRSTATAS
ncbi:MAG: pyridoxamine 5'-phosphate oxidase family protein [Gammaproteobacteria bacterium]|nr:pyridoxamine 5'-phosphate oxidase family protein [Gammaproteobacteria bacterium]